MARKQVEGHASKQAPANRFIYTQVVKFHIMGNDPSYDFTDWDKAIRNYQNGKLVLMYTERHGYQMHRCAPNSQQSIAPNRNGELGMMTPQVTIKEIATLDRKYHPLDAKEMRKLYDAYQRLNESDGIQYNF